MHTFAAAKELKDEITLRRDFASQEEAVILSYLFTSQRMTKLAYDFFASYGLSDAQFNVLILLWDLRHEKVLQWTLADKLLVNRASIGGLVDRMCRKGFVKRAADSEDKRAMRVTLTAKGIRVLEQVKKPYYSILKRAFRGFSSRDMGLFLRYLNQFRKGVTLIHAKFHGRESQTRALN